MRSLHQSSGAQRGSILFTAAVLITILGSLVLSLLGTTVLASESTDRSIDMVRAQTASDAATSLAANSLWTGFESTAGSGPLRPWDFQAYLTGLGIPDQAGVANPVSTDITHRINLPMQDGLPAMDGVQIESLELVRRDEWNKTRLEFTAVAAVQRGSQNGRSGATTSAITQVFEVGAAEWGGLDYTLLANNVNCLLCHAEFDDAQHAYSSDPGAGQFERVRLGSIESIVFRHDPDSWFAGTLYVGGDALYSDGTPISNWANLDLQSRSFDNTGVLQSDAFGALIPEHLAPANNSNPASFENLYLDYFSGGTTSQVDGELPQRFPPPFPDDGGYDFGAGQPTPAFGGNRIVDDNEFYATVNGFTGQVTGGSIGVSPLGATATTSAQLGSLVAGNTPALGAITEANIVLHGTTANPIRLDGEIAVKGDVVLSGVIAGTGSLMASGNVYLPGDLTYADAVDANGNRTFGTALDGSGNGLAIAAGGNVVIGDPRHPRWGQGSPTDGRPGTSFNFIMDELGIFNRMEWIKSSPPCPASRSPTRKRVPRSRRSTPTTCTRVRASSRVTTPSTRTLRFRSTTRVGTTIPTLRPGAAAS